MSPLPSPTPLRRTIARLVFSPAVLVCGFVVFLIMSCPNARGGDGSSILITNGSMPFVDGGDILSLDIPVAVTRPVTARDMRPRLEGTKGLSTRSATLEEGGAWTPAGGETELFRHTRSTLPLLVEPLEVDATRPPVARLSPMTGPAVGVRAKVPASTRE